MVWHDVTRHTGWISQHGAKEIGPVSCLTVGILVQNNRFVKIAQTLTSDGEWGDVLIVPRALVESIERFN